MSSALAIAAVTAILKNLIANSLAARGAASRIGGEVSVSVLAPDHITTGTDERPQLNLFLYHITPNTSLTLSKRLSSSIGERAESSPPLVLDLHYLVTAYGAQDMQVELLLGYAIQILHEKPVLKLASADNGGIPSPISALLAEYGLSEQVEQLEIKPQFLSIEELSKLWSALQARYRPSVAYKVSLILINGQH